MTKIYRNSGTHLFLLFWKASHSIMSFDRESIQKVGCGSLTDFAVLELLLHKGSMPVNEIGEKVLLTSGSITTAVQRLEKKGLVERIRDDLDRRVVRVELTQVGRSLIESSFREHSQRLDELFSVFTEEEKDQFGTLVRKIGVEAEAKKG
ncbi:MarR family winged helix-turn-helix transcriptional regulator [Puniceicoccus vermicola]|uniref:MarR family transcriptional regulator n=1 Tax=Puniceicoccus vermicola TaxID=388746 RepID=A0A7X1AWX1_9BACT|nr:MarR family transcriptional regulator [Puniceicoccus vermicola]MBC2601510.1 MarR family transcriptional regulator [Puniceicoccus vermicola]